MIVVQRQVNVLLIVQPAEVAIEAGAVHPVKPQIPLSGANACSRSRSSRYIFNAGCLECMQRASRVIGLVAQLVECFVGSVENNGVVLSCEVGALVPCEVSALYFVRQGIEPDNFLG